MPDTMSYSNPSFFSFFFSLLSFPAFQIIDSFHEESLCESFFLGQTGLVVTSIVKLLINTGHSGIILVLNFNDLFRKLFYTK